MNKKYEKQDSFQDFPLALRPISFTADYLNAIKLILILTIISLVIFAPTTYIVKNAEARCPNGYHKGANGKCEKFVLHKGKHRCPNGYHRSPDGSHCEKVSDTPKDNDNSVKTTISHKDRSNTPKSEISNVSPIQSSAPQNLASSSLQQQQSSFLTYENPTYGFSLQYPSTWQKTEQPEAGRVVSFDEINKGVQVYIKFDKLPSQYATLTQYVNTLVNQLGNDRKDFSLIEYYPNLTLHNNPAYKVVYLSTKKVGVNIGTHYETMRLWMIKDDNVYTLVYVTQPNLFPQYLPIANNMLKSFKITR